MMPYAILTPTGDRPEAFALCRRYVQRQTVPPTQWLVVDDGHEPIPPELRDGAFIIRREPQPDEGHTLRLNLLDCLRFVTCQRVLIVEDDDWYPPDYAERVLPWLDKFDMAGFGKDVQYHLPTKGYRTVANRKHASLHQTAMTAKALPTLREVCRDSGTGFQVDMRLWERFAGLKHIEPQRQAVGIKGMPGRPGETRGQQASSWPKCEEDPDGIALSALVGTDASAYEELRHASE